MALSAGCESLSEGRYCISAHVLSVLTCLSGNMAAPAMFAGLQARTSDQGRRLNGGHATGGHSGVPRTHREPPVLKASAMVIYCRAPLFLNQVAALKYLQHSRLCRKVVSIFGWNDRKNFFLTKPSTIRDLCREMDRGWVGLKRMLGIFDKSVQII